MLFDRVVEVIAGKSGGQGVLIDKLRINFSIEKTSTETLNNSKIKIYNLSENTRKQVEIANNAVILKAGYSMDGGPKTIFVGIIRRSLTVKEGQDWITEIELDDGLLSYRDSKDSIAFDKGASGLAVLKFVASKFDLPVRPLPDVQDKSYPKGFSFVGRTRECMTNVCNYLGLEWSIQNQEIQIIKKGGTLQSKAFVISEETGMIESPALEAKTLSDKAAGKRGITSDSAGVIKRRKETVDGEIQDRLEVQGYKVKTLLNPLIEPGAIVQLKSRGIEPAFLRVEKVNHNGDSQSGPYETEIVLRFI
jgi:hypothetical protein